MPMTMSVLASGLLGRKMIATCRPHAVPFGAGDMWVMLTFAVDWKEKVNEIF